MYQYRCVHRNTDTDSTDTGLTDDTDTLTSVSLITLKHWDRCHRQHWNTDISVTDDTETLKSVPPTTLKHRKSVFHRQCWCIHRLRNVTNQMGMSKCIISDTDLSVFSVVSDTAISVSVSSVTPISVFQWYQWHWCRFCRCSVYRHWYIPSLFRKQMSTNSDV